MAHHHRYRVRRRTEPQCSFVKALRWAVKRGILQNATPSFILQGLRDWSPREKPAEVDHATDALRYYGSHQKFKIPNDPNAPFAPDAFECMSEEEFRAWEKRVIDKLRGSFRI